MGAVVSSLFTLVTFWCSVNPAGEQLEETARCHVKAIDARSLRTQSRIGHRSRVKTEVNSIISLGQGETALGGRGIGEQGCCSVSMRSKR